MKSSSPAEITTPSSPSPRIIFRIEAMPALVTVLVLLQLLDLHSSLTSDGGVEMNHLLKVAAAWSGPLPALLFGKSLAMAGAGSLYLVWKKFPSLRQEANLYASLAVAVYAFIVASNYGVIG